MNKLEKIYLHTGSNMGHKEGNLKRSRQLIEQNIGSITAQSGLFETEAWGLTDQPNFVNQALEVITSLSPEIVMERILEIENEMGRVRSKKWAPRIIDIDIIFFGRHIVKTENLVIPHPHMHKRNFVLIPLCEIAKDVIHPKFDLSVEQLYQCTVDQLKVNAQPIK